MREIVKFWERLRQSRETRQRRQEFERVFEDWRFLNPTSPYAEFYTENAKQRITVGLAPAKHLGVDIDSEPETKRASRVVKNLRACGLAPHHLVVDFGCGSLWIGEALMRYLEPGNYIGMDVIDDFYTEGLTRLDAQMVNEK